MHHKPSQGVVSALRIHGLFAAGKANPEKHTYGTSGIGGSGHLMMIEIEQKVGSKFTHIPYKGAGAVIAAMIGGEVDMGFVASISALPHIRSGKLRVHAVTTARPASALPGVPPMANFVPGFDTDIWYGAWLPAGVQKPVLDRWVDELRKVHGHPDVRAAFERDGAEGIFLPPAEFAVFLKKEVAKYAELVKRSGARATD
jgi:tripartite-type tricarboxylate transporter receptor subunit TctC